MAAMMFPAISPMVLLYDRNIKNKSNNEASPSKKEKQPSNIYKYLSTSIPDKILS
jgi:hypothetical protein